MATNAVASLIFGRLFDRLGLPVVLIAVLLSAPFAALVFLGNFYLALVGMVLWGMGFATQDTLLKAIIAGLLPEGRRNLAFGLFYTGYGCGWLLGSVTTGLLYDRSLPLLLAFSVAVQLTAWPLVPTAHRDRNVVLDRREFAERLRLVGGQVVAPLPHEGDGPRIDFPRGPGTRTGCLNPTGTVHAGKGLRHLAPVTVLDADK